VQSNSLQVHVEAVADGYVLKAHAPCKASMQAALSALLRINPDAYDVIRLTEWVGSCMGNPDLNPGGAD
jgi:hypothetical protein